MLELAGHIVTQLQFPHLLYYTLNIKHTLQQHYKLPNGRLLTIPILLLQQLRVFPKRSRHGHFYLKQMVLPISSNLRQVYFMIILKNISIAQNPSYIIMKLMVLTGLFHPQDQNIHSLNTFLPNLVHNPPKRSLLNQRRR